MKMMMNGIGHRGLHEIIKEEISKEDYFRGSSTIELSALQWCLSVDKETPQISCILVTGFNNILQAKSM